MVAHLLFYKRPPVNNRLMTMFQRILIDNHYPSIHIQEKSIFFGVNVRT